MLLVTFFQGMDWLGPELRISNEDPPTSYHLLNGAARLPFTARIERYTCSLQACSVSL